MQNSISFEKIHPESGLKAALDKAPAAVVDTLTQSGLRGRGGAGFPTGLKWKLAAQDKGENKVIICNADEGEPGTFKDRMLLSNWADVVFDGMIIAGYAVGAKLGIVYLRGEYAYLRQPLEDRLQLRRDMGLLGNDILGKKGFSFDIHIHMGCGAYVCGEESALIEALEGKRGQPRNRPPFPVSHGLFNAPTVVNNVETLAWAAAVFAFGLEWFKSVGTEKSSGFKLLSISGDVSRSGVYEFPMGTKISDILEAAGAQNPKAAVIGGASGVLVPAKDFGRTICFEDVATGGSVIVLGEQRDLLDILENFQEFFTDESCGQCTICRMGNIKLLEGIRMMKEGRCTTKYIAELLSLGESMKASSKCGLGQASPNMFISVIKHFKKELMGRPQIDDPASKRKAS